MNMQHETPETPSDAPSVGVPLGTPRIWVPDGLAAGANLALPERAARHVMALRLEEGEHITLFDGHGGEWDAALSMQGRGRFNARVGAFRAIERESPVVITLALGISSGDRMDLAIQKSTELGVAVIQPIATTRSVVRLKNERAEKRIAHWEGVAIAACEQCGRNRLPEIRPIQTLLDVVSQPAAGAKLLLSPRGEVGLKSIPPARHCTVLIGAEGGLSPEEREDALRAGYQEISFGPRVLRTETAPLAVIAALQCLWGDC